MALSEYLEQLAQVFWPGRYIKIGTHFSNPWQHARVEHMHKDSGVLQIRYSEDMRQDHLILTEDYKRIHIDLRECSPHQYPPGIRVRFRPSPTTTLEGTLISATKEEFTVYRNPNYSVLKLADLITTVETMWTPSAPPNDPIPSSSVSKEDKSTAAPPPVPTLPVTHHQSAEAQTPNQLDPATMIKFWGAGRPLELWSPKHKVWEPVVVASAKLPSYLNVRFSAASKFDTTGFNTTGFNTKEATAKETKDVKEINSTIDVSKEGGRLRLPRNLNIVSERAWVEDMQAEHVRNRGASGFILSRTWFQSWCDYSQRNAPKPKKINNASLLQTSKPLHLRPGLMEALDFVVVSPTLWGFFCDHYGGGPAIERLFPNKQSVLVIATQRISGIELYPLFVDIHLAQSSTICTLKHKQFMVSKTWSLRQVLQTFAPTTNESKEIKEVKETPGRVWLRGYGVKDTKGSEWQLVPELEYVHPFETWKQTQRPQEILLEFRKPDGTWIRKESEKTQSKEMQPSGSELVMQPILGIPSIPGTVGLRNMGQTCYMNSALQCLSANEQLTRYFLSHAHLQDLNTDNQHGAGGQLAVAYGRLLEQMWFGSGIEGQDNKASKKEEGDPHVACTALVPHAFKRVFCSFRPIFYEEVQQDAQEFLTQFLDGLAEDTKLPPPERVRPAVAVTTVTEDEKELANRTWKFYTERLNSAITKQFSFLVKTVSTCGECKKTKTQFDPANLLCLPIPNTTYKSEGVYFMPLPPGSRPIPLCVSCPEQETVAFLKSALVAQLASKSPPIHVKEKNLLVCGVAWSRVESIYEDKQPLNGIERRSAILRIYELPRNAYDMRMHPLPPILLDSKASKAPDVSKEVSEASDLSKDKNEDQTKWEDKYVQIPVAHATRVEHDSFEKAGIPSFVYLARSRLQQFPMVEIHDLCMALIGNQLPNDWSGKSRTDAIWNMCLMDLKFATVKLRKVAMVGTENLDELFKTGGGFTIVCLWYQGPDWKSAETPLLVIPSQATDQKQIDLKACLDANFQEDVEKQARVCSDCKKSSFFRNQTFLWQAPEILVLVLRRFVPNSTEKNQTQVNFGTAGVNLERYFAATSIPHDAKSMIAHDYDVFGSIHHMGHYLGSGHFVAFARNWIDQNWYFFDDEKVQPVADQTQICSRDAYIVFLQKRKK